MKTINIYKYNELPSESAKERARDWWLKTEEIDPAWKDEHNESLKCALEALTHDLTKSELIEQSEYCQWTGYFADGLLADLIYKLGRKPTQKELINHFNENWQDELDYRSSKEYIEDELKDSDYHFLENGNYYLCSHD